MSSVRKAWHVLRLLGPRFVTLRAGLFWNRLTGRTRRVFAARPWEALDLRELTTPGTPTACEEYAGFKRQQSLPFFFPLGVPPLVPDAIRKAPAQRQPDLRRRLDLLAEDRCVYFFRTPSPSPVDWAANPLEETRCPADRDWFDIPDFRSEQGDMRTMWEPARAAWALDLARARAHGVSIDAGGLFWRWVDSWMNACPPFRGPQWKCGQESSTRLLAIMIGAWSLADDPATTPQRWTQLARLAWATGYRVFHHIDYAVSQKNNHALSEALGLLLIAQLFPELRDAARWGATGRRVLSQELARQVADDGSYVQHSMGYHRVMLQVSLAALRLAELAERPFEPGVYDRLARAGEFLFELSDRTSGRCPNYGNNDGALPLPLNECDFTDFRPVLQATHYLVQRKRLFGSGPWDEDLLWLFGAAALPAHAEPPRWPGATAFRDGGYYTLQGRESWAMIRCHTWRDRPAHYDQLHLDLWWRGQNVIQDCGTFRYYDAKRPDVEHYFKSSRAHNLVEVGGREPLTLASRFLWLPWPRGAARRFDAGGLEDARLGVFEGESFDYLRRPWRTMVRRSVIRRAPDTWVVVDDLCGRGASGAVLRWHLLDGPYRFDAGDFAVRLETPEGVFSLALAAWPAAPQSCTMVRGRDEAHRVQGFSAPYYGRREPIPVIEAIFGEAHMLRVVTVLAPGEPAAARLSSDTPHFQRWRVDAAGDSWELELAQLEPGRRFRNRVTGCVVEPSVCR